MVAVLASPIVCGDSFAPELVIFFEFESLVADGDVRATVLIMLLLLLLFSLLADFDLELTTWLRAKSYSHLRKSGFLYGDNGFVPSRFLNDSLDATEHFTVEFDVAGGPYGGRLLILADMGLLVFSALDVAEIGNFFTGNLFVAPLAASDDGFLLFELVKAPDTTIESLNALLLLMLLIGLLLLMLWLLLIVLLLLVLVFFRLNLPLPLVVVVFWLLLLMLDALVAFEYEHREWDKLVGNTLNLAHGFTLMDADVEMGDDERLIE